MTPKHALLLWAIYFLGQSMHVLKKANLTVASPKNNLQSLWQYVVFNGPALTVRLFLCSLAFWGFFQDPQIVSKIFARFGINLGLEVPLTGATAGIFGYFADSGLDYFTAKSSRLQRELPQEPPK